MLKILTSGKNANINRLNGLVDEYNSKSTPAVIRYALLNQIATLAQDLYIELNQNSGSAESIRNSANFFKWYSTNPVGRELANYGQSPVLGMTGDKSLMQITQGANPIPSLANWIKATTPVLKKRNPTYEELDEKIQQVNALKTGNPADYFSALTALKNTTLNYLNQPNLDNKPVARKRLRELLSSINAELNEVTNQLPDYLNEQVKQQEVAEGLFGHLLNGDDPEVASQFVISLRDNAEVDSIPGYTIRELGLATGNNKNFKAINNLSDEVHMVSLLKSTNFNPKTLLRLTENKDLAPYITKQYSQYVAEGIPSRADKDYLERFAVTVSEFCKAGDLAHCQRVAVAKGATLDERLDNAIDYCEQTSQFISLLLDNNLCHPDIKAENFLENDNGHVVISDLKTIKTVAGPVNSYEITNTPQYAPPEHSSGQAFNIEHYSSYQIGLMLYDLATTTPSSDKMAWVTALTEARDTMSLDNDPNISLAQALSFDDPIFDTEQGQEIKTLIENCLRVDPNLRPEPYHIAAQLREIQTPSLRQQHDTEVAANPTISNAALALRERIHHLKTTSLPQSSSPVERHPAVTNTITSMREQLRAARNKTADSPAAEEQTLHQTRLKT